MLSDSKRIQRSYTTSDKTSSSSSHKVFDPELEPITKRKLRFDSFSTKENNKAQKLNPKLLVQNILFALKHFYEDSSLGFEKACRDFFMKGGETMRLKIIDKINAYEYLEKGIKHKSFMQIEVEVLKEWKKNYILFAIMTFWYNSVQQSKFKSLNEFQKEYATFGEFISQITYLIFKGCFSNLEKKGLSILDKLSDQTAHFIITDSGEFKKIYSKIVLPLMWQELKLQGALVNWEFDLNSLNLKKMVVDLEKKENLPKTIEALKKFAKETKLVKKINLIKEVRETLDQELLQNQTELIEKKELKEYKVLDKDDFISAYVYCIICGEIEGIEVAALYIDTLLGEKNQLLSKMLVEASKTDIMAAIDYLTQESESKLIVHPVIQTDKVTQSLSLIEDEYEMKSPIKLSSRVKHMTSFDPQY